MVKFLVCLDHSLDNLGYDPNKLKILCKMNKETDIIIGTPVRNTDHMRVGEVVKQGTIF